MLIIRELQRLHSDPFAARPPRWFVTTLGLQLVEHNEVGAAKRAIELEASVYGDDAGNPTNVARQEMARELAKIAAVLPTDVAVSLARSLREQEPAHGLVALTEALRRHGGVGQS